MRVPYVRADRNLCPRRRVLVQEAKKSVEGRDRLGPVPGGGGAADAEVTDGLLEGSGREIDVVVGAALAAVNDLNGDLAGGALDLDAAAAGLLGVEEGSRHGNDQVTVAVGLATGAKAGVVVSSLTLSARSDGRSGAGEKGESEEKSGSELGEHVDGGCLRWGYLESCRLKKRVKSFPARELSRLLCEEEKALVVKERKKLEG